MKSFKTYLQEKYMQRSTGCFMVEFPDYDSNVIRNLINSIPDEYVYDDENGKYGKEDSPHVTIRYGVDINNIESDIPEAWTKLGNITLDIKGPDIFAREEMEYDVLYLSLSRIPRIFLELREFIENTWPCRENTHPTYIPHITLSYMKKGTAQKFINEMDEKKWLLMQPLTVTVDKIVYSKPNSMRYIIPTNVT